MSHIESNNRFLWLFLVFSLLFLPARSLWAAANLIVKPAGEGVFVLQGAGLSGVSGMDITVTYDQSALANPRVEKTGVASNGMFAVNPNVPGMIRIGAVFTSAVAGDGPIATISFDRRGTKTGAKISVTASFIDDKGAKIDVAGSNQSQSSTDTSSAATGQQGSSPSPQTTGGSSQPTAPATGAPGMLGVTMPGEATAVSEKKPEAKAVETQPELPSPSTAGTVPAESTEVAKVESEAKAAGTPPAKKFVAYQSVLEKFKDFTPGKQSPESLLALFKSNSEAAYSQEPRIVLTDGETPVELTLRLTAGGDKVAPNFALNNAAMVSLKRTEDGAGWIIKVLPKKGVYDASLTISQENSITMIPLTVAPPLAEVQLKGVDGVTMSGFTQYLKGRGTKGASHDLNNDGKHDYIDDYIYAANYLVAQEKTKTPTKISK